MKTELNEVNLLATPTVSLQATNPEATLARLEDVVRSIEDAPEVTAARNAYEAAKLRTKKENDALSAIQGRINSLTKSIRQTQESLESELVEHYQAEGAHTPTPKPVRDLIDQKSEQQIASSTITSLVERRLPQARFAEHRAAGTYARSQAEELKRLAHEHFRRITEGLREVIEAEGILTLDINAGFTGLLIARAIGFGSQANIFFKNADEDERKWKEMHNKAALNALGR